MAERKIITLRRHEKTLRTKSEPVKKLDKETRALAQDIKDTIEANPAVGLAAVQIGVLKRVFGARLGYYAEQEDEEMQPPTIFINPEIIAQGEVVKNDSDACLSIPGMMGYTDRALSLRLRYMDESGQIIERDFEGWDARAIQHEMDHLNGVLFLDRLRSLDDLYMYVRGEDGRTKTVRYTDAMKQANQSALQTPPPNGKDTV
jgi:peptide deformylase